MFTILEDKPVDSYKRQEFKNRIILPESQAQFIAYAQSQAVLWRVVAKIPVKINSNQRRNGPEFIIYAA
ncbi:MAG: hypothetical protein LV471_07060 [Nitrosomonas sp.]|nr:hypothetical protein [Nitrosomonas sp.]